MTEPPWTDAKPFTRSGSCRPLESAQPLLPPPKAALPGGLLPFRGLTRRSDAGYVSRRKLGRLASQEPEAGLEPTA